jgi:hypothetical protein
VQLLNAAPVSQGVAGTEIKEEIVYVEIKNYRKY